MNNLILFNLNIYILGVFTYIFYFYICNKIKLRGFLSPVVRMLTAGGVTGAITYMVFKMLDRYSWGQGLALGPIQLPTTLYNVVVDTSYTVNLIYFTLMIGFFGLALYLLLSYLMGVAEVGLVFKAVKKGRKLLRFPAGS